MYKLEYSYSSRQVTNAEQIFSNRVKLAPKEPANPHNINRKSTHKIGITRLAFLSWKTKSTGVL